MRKSSLKIKDEIATKQARGKEIIALAKKEVRDLTEEEEKEVNDLKREIQELKDDLEEVKKRAEELTFDENEEQDSRSEEEETTDENKEEAADEETQEEEAPKEEENKRSMKKKNFSLARAIRSVIENKPFDKVDEAYINEGIKESRDAGVSAQGQIVLPVQQRGVITVTAEGEDLVETKIEPLLMPLRPDAVLREAGIKYVSGLQGDVQFPIMGKENCFFEGEVSTAQDGASGFTHVTLTPKRITAYVDVSRKALIQAATNVDLENAIISDLQKAIEEKVESTFLADGSGTTTQFAGIFDIVEPTSGISTFAGICDLEADVEDANVKGNCLYVMGTKCKSAMRSMAKSTKSTQLVFENGEVDGTKAIATSMVSGKNYVYGDFSNAVVGHWNTNLLVDPYTQATKSTVRIIAETWVDAAVLRPEAFVTGTLA